MSAKEYDLWIAEYQIEPWGEARADLRSEKVVLSNLAPHVKEIKVKDCFLNFEPPKEQVWTDWQKDLLQRTRLLGGEVR